MRTPKHLQSGKRKDMCWPPKSRHHSWVSAWFSTGGPWARMQEVGGRCYNKAFSDGNGMRCRIRWRGSSSQVVLAGASAGALLAPDLQSAGQRAHPLVPGSPGPARPWEGESDLSVLWPLVPPPTPRELPSSFPGAEEIDCTTHVFLKTPVKRGQRRPPNITPQHPRAMARPSSPGEPPGIPSNRKGLSSWQEVGKDQLSSCWAQCPGLCHLWPWNWPDPCNSASWSEPFQRSQLFPKPFKTTSQNP